MRLFFQRQIRKIHQGGITVLLRKGKPLCHYIARLPVYFLVFPFVLIIRLIRPWLLVRLRWLMSTRIGHFAANTELYLCERDAGIDVPNRRHIDIFYIVQPLCNQQLSKMWQRTLHVWPIAWFIGPLYRLNRLIPGGYLHEIGNNTQSDRDVHNLMERFPPHLEFIEEEELWGEDGLRDMGIPQGAPFVCLTVRDSSYLAMHNPSVDYSYHNYRDASIKNYILAAEALAERGYFVVRMGVKVHEVMNSAHPKVIDYACNGMRSDFMDIYLGAKCAFCITVGSGFDAVPAIFRRPILQVNAVPFGYCWTGGSSPLLLTKHHVDISSGRELTMSEIFSRDVGFLTHSLDYTSRGVKLMENTAEEIRDVAIEMAERLNDTWQAHPEDEALQQRFWEIFPTNSVDAHKGKPLHGEIRARFSANFLRNNPEWLQ